MTEIIDRFETQAGTTYTKERTESGRTQYRKNGQFTSSQSFAAGKSHTTTAELKRGTIDASDVERTDLNKPYDATAYMPTDAFDDGSYEQQQAREANRFYGFLQAEGTPDDRVEAALEYEQMIRELEQSNSAAQDREIKEQYNIGGS